MDEPKKIPPETENTELQVDAILEQLSQPQKVDAEEPLPLQSETELPLEALNDPVLQPEENSAVEKRKKKKKKNSKNSKGCLVTIIWLLVIGLVSVGLAIAGLFVASDYLGIGKDFIRGEETRTVQIYVKEGTSVQEIARQLEEQDVLINRHVFLLYLKLTKKGNNMNYGAHDFSTKMGYSEILDSLAKPAKAEDVEVVVPAGKTVDEIFRILEEAGVCSYSDLRNELLNGTFDSPLLSAVPKNEAIYYAAEGYLFPDTYSFYLNDSPNRVIQKMLDNLEEKFTPAMRQKAKDQGYTTHEIMTMASMVEMEACGYFKEMPKVSAVFYNRLKNWPAGARLLQSDPTMNYPYGNGKYDTYKVEGLPPGPIGSVTKSAIEAALQPDTTVKEYYFVTDTNGRFYYNETLSAHEATISELRRKGLWMYS